MRWYWKVLIIAAVLSSCSREKSSDGSAASTAFKNYLQQHEYSLEDESSALGTCLQQVRYGSNEEKVEVLMTYLQRRKNSLENESYALRTYLQQSNSNVN
jgi:hypothetical protein